MPARKNYRYKPTNLIVSAEMVPEDRHINTTFEGQVFAAGGDYLVFDGMQGTDVGVWPAEKFEREFEEVLPDHELG